jgi:hypothetical protein
LGLEAKDATGSPQYTASVSASSSVHQDSNGASTAIQSTQIQLTDSTTLSTTISSTSIIFSDPPNTTSTTFYNDGFASSNPSVNAPYVITGGYTSDDGFTSITTDPTDPNNPNESAQLRGAGGLKLQTNNWSQPPDLFTEEVILTSGGKDSILNNTGPRLEFNHIGDQDAFRYRVNGSDVAFMAGGSWVFLENVGVTIYGTTAQRVAQFYQGFLGFYDNIGVASNIKIDPKNAISGKPDITLTDGTTSNTINQNGYTTRNSVQNATYYLNFSDSSSTGVGAIQKTAGISCNPSTNILTATGYIGTSLNSNSASAVSLQANGTTKSSITTSGVQQTLLTTQGTATYATSTLTLVTTAAPYPTFYYNIITITGTTNTISTITPPANMPVNAMYYCYITNSGSGILTINATTLGTGIKTTYTAAVSVPAAGFALGTLTKVGAATYIWSVNLVA